MGRTKAHTPGTQGSSNIRQIGLSCYFHYYSYGAAFLLIDWIPLTINKPAVLVLLLLSGIYKARIEFWYQYQAEFTPRLIPLISLEVQNPKLRNLDKRGAYRALFE